MGEKSAKAAMHRLTKTGKTLPFNFCFSIQMVGSVLVVQTVGFVKVLERFYRDTLRLFLPIEHLLNTTAYLSIVADHADPFKTSVPSSDGCLQQDIVTRHGAQIISNCFLEHDSELTVLKWPPESPDLSPIENLLDVVEREIDVVDELTKNAIMSI